MLKESKMKLSGQMIALMKCLASGHTLNWDPRVCWSPDANTNTVKALLARGLVRTQAGTYAIVLTVAGQAILETPEARSNS